ncbi:hypothetical protein LSUE1_G008507 [Lachnellula suecica]|uniref:Uncharacterized protein n=1 Tax=Lachnellula suecica TaxID=602035 RepID=A0A8T9BUT8_9HELO|nr:hypothetical protein LSUE1_G008507 [Lachnellula suecica]
MQLSKLLSAASLLFAASAFPTELIERQSNTTPIATADLYIGACMAIGTCYYDTANQKGCYTHGCANESSLGSICSCNADVQSAIDVQNTHGRSEWPVKCT